MKIENGFIYGTLWTNPKQTVAIPMHTVERIQFNCGNEPPADRVHRLHNLPHIDLLSKDPWYPTHVDHDRLP